MVLAPPKPEKLAPSVTKMEVPYLPEMVEWNGKKVESNIKPVDPLPVTVYICDHCGHHSIDSISDPILFRLYFMEHRCVDGRKHSEQFQDLIDARKDA